MFNFVFYISSLKKYFKKVDICIIFTLIALYFFTRLINLDNHPIFSDEGIYIHWSKVAWHDASWRFISLTDGRQPFQTWATIPFLKLFPNNALYAGRLFAVVSGFTALTGLFSLLTYIFNKKTAYIGSFLYIITPYFLFLDRIALVDSAVNAGVIWMLLFSLILVKTLRLDVALLLGVIAGFTLLAKSSARLYLMLLPMTIIMLPQLLNRKKELKNKKLPILISYITLYLVAFSIAIVIYNVQRLSPFFHYVSEKNKTFVLTFSELIKNPFQLVFTNTINIPMFLSVEMAYVIVVISIIGYVYMYKHKRSFAIAVGLYWIFSFIAIASIAKVLFPRYVLTLGMLFLIPASYYIANIVSKKIAYLLISITIISVLYYNYTLLFDFKNTPFHEIDRGQYIEGWTAGWGAKEIVEYARIQSKKKPVILIAEGDFGMAGDVLDIFVKPGERITIKPYWPLNKDNLVENQKELKNNYIYVVFAHRDEFPSDWPVKSIAKYNKPGSNSALYLFELL